MHMEITQAVDFLGRFVQTKMPQDDLSSFKDDLSSELRERFENHWHAHEPMRGSGYRSISNFNGALDPILTKVACRCKVDPSLIHDNLPRDFILWIDPYSVSYRVGDRSNIMTLFEDRTRGRITFK
ncbi:hypothetical protein BCR43DRAFT_416205, partial [Syncephalastrum racemosum]